MFCVKMSLSCIIAILSSLLTCSCGVHVTLRLENSETKETTEKSEDSSEQASSIINGLATAATEVAENAGMLQS